MDFNLFDSLSCVLTPAVGCDPSGFQGIFTRAFSQHRLHFTVSLCVRKY